MSAIACRGVGVTFGSRRVLVDVDLDIARGEWATIVGPNGAGKSTLLSCIGGGLAHDGTVEVAGSDLATTSVRQRARLMAQVPQHPVVPAGMRLADYVLLGRTPHLSLLGVEGAGDRRVVAGVLERLNLTHLGDHRLDTLSGGELQRAHLARAVAQESPVLLLDEPTAALDLGHQQDALELIDELRRERDLTVLSTMHDLTVAGLYSDRLVLLREGRIVGDGPVAVVMTEDGLSDLYGARVRVLRDGDGVVVVPVRGARHGSDG